MKDVQGIERGECKASGCKCEEYTAPSTSDKLRCESCNHTPREHVRITVDLKLGQCTMNDDCDAHESEDKSSCTECQYCNCAASDYEGAEKSCTSKASPLAPSDDETAEDLEVQMKTDNQKQQTNLPHHMNTSQAIMKDIQGIERGKCKASDCKCKEYKLSSISGKLRCEGCNHTPIQHDKIEGRLKCDAFKSENKSSHADCDCQPSDHEGDEKMAEPEASPLSQSQTTSSSSATEGPIPGIKENLDPGVKLRTDDQGRPTQTTVYGCCVCSGCSYPKSIVDGTVHDYCSKTCAKKCEWMNQHSSDGANQPKLHPARLVEPVHPPIPPPPQAPPPDHQTDDQPTSESLPESEMDTS